MRKEELIKQVAESTGYCHYRTITMKTVKKYWKPVLVVSAFFIGNRVFNHINAWLGISIIMLTVAFIVYNIIKKK